MSWVYVPTPNFTQMIENGRISSVVTEAIESWAKSVSNKYQNDRLKMIYRSPKNSYEIWSAGIPNPESNQGKSGGYRVVYFLNLIESSINLDFIESRKELGFKHEGKRKKSKYNNYINNLKKNLKNIE